MSNKLKHSLPEQREYTLEATCLTNFSYVIDLDDDKVTGTRYFLSYEIGEWLGKEVYVKNMQRHGTVVNYERDKMGYSLLIDCYGFYLRLSKQHFALGALDFTQKHSKDPIALMF